MTVVLVDAKNPVLACVGMGAVEIAVIRPALLTLITGTAVAVP